MWEDSYRLVSYGLLYWHWKPLNFFVTTFFFHIYICIMSNCHDAEHPYIVYSDHAALCDVQGIYIQIMLSVSTVVAYTRGVNRCQSVYNEDFAVFSTTSMRSLSLPPSPPKRIYIYLNTVLPGRLLRPSYPLTSRDGRRSRVLSCKLVFCENWPRIYCISFNCYLLFMGPWREP